MRDFKGMKRQRGRNRNAGGGNKPQQHNANRAFDSNGPEGIKVRGNAQHVFEKYQQLARDAQSGGDRVLAENYLQHAEHYFRLIRVVTPTRSVQDIVGRDAFASGHDIDFEDESGAQAYVEQPEPEAQPQNNGGGNQGDQQRQDNGQQRNNGDYQQRDRDRDRNQNQNRDDRPRDRDRYQNDRPRDDRPREDRPRNNDQPREDRPRYRDRDRNRDDRPRDDRADPMAVVEPTAAPLPREEASSPVLRSGDGDMSHAPAFLAPRAPRTPKPAVVADAAPEAEAKPKRKRTPKAEEA